MPLLVLPLSETCTSTWQCSVHSPLIMCLLDCILISPMHRSLSALPCLPHPHFLFSSVSIWKIPFLLQSFLPLSEPACLLHKASHVTEGIRFSSPFHQYKLEKKSGEGREIMRLLIKNDCDENAKPSAYLKANVSSFCTQKLQETPCECMTGQQ